SCSPRSWSPTPAARRSRTPLRPEQTFRASVGDGSDFLHRSLAHSFKKIDALAPIATLYGGDMMNRLLEQLCQPSPASTDAQLLARFVAARDEAAFAALVRRHGPMVLGVCRRVLRHQEDAEDAFQATVLVLAQKAG